MRWVADGEIICGLAVGFLRVFAVRYLPASFQFRAQGVQVIACRGMIHEVIHVSARNGRTFQAVLLRAGPAASGVYIGETVGW